MQWALKLREIFGPRNPIALIPLLVQEKVPAVKWRWINDENRAPTPDELRGMWRGLGRPNVGMVTGPASCDLYFLDADNERGVEWLDENAPPTMLYQLTRHGLHAGHRAPRGLFTNNRADILGSKARFAWEAEQMGYIVHPRKLPPGSPEKAYEEEAERARDDMELALKRIEMGPIIDVRGRGGQIVAPGSIHPDGHVYMWPEEYPWSEELFESMDLIDPTWLDSVERWQNPDKRVTQVRVPSIERIITGDEKMKRAAAWLERTPGAIAGQRGHDHTFYVANKLINGFAMSPSDAFDMMMGDWNNSCDPPWTPEEIAHKVEDAAEKVDANHGYMLEDRPEFLIKSYAPKSDKRKLGNPILHSIKPVYGFEPKVIDAEFAESQGKEDPPQSAIDENAGDELVILLARFGVDFNELVAKGYTDWRAVHKKTGGGFTWQLPDTTNNIAMVLQFAQGLRGQFWLDTLKMKRMMGDQSYSDKFHAHLVKRQIDSIFEKEVRRDNIRDAIRIACAENSVDKIGAFIERIKPWDGVDRFQFVIENIFGNSKNEDGFELKCRMLQNTMVGMMARMVEPGCKFDTVTIFQGGQGFGKTSFFQNLLPQGFVTDSPVNLRSKDCMLQLATHVVVEIGEFASLRRHDELEQNKAFITSRVDTFRPPYAEDLIEVPRRCIFIATANDKELMYDDTGERRFYVVPVRRFIDEDEVLKIRDQLLAQALHHYRALKSSKKGSDDWNKYRYWFTPLDDTGHKEYMRDYQDQHPWTDRVADYIAGKAGEMINATDILVEVIRKDLDKVNAQDSRAMAKILKRLGCVQLDRVRVGGRQRRMWRVPVSMRQEADEMSREEVLSLLHGDRDP